MRTKRSKRRSLIRSRAISRPRRRRAVISTVISTAAAAKAAVAAATATVKISGSGNINLLQAPALTLPTSFELYDVKSSESLRNGSAGSFGYKKFEYPFIARAEGSYTIQRYGENNISAGIFYRGDTYSTCVLGYPFETIKSEVQRDALMNAILSTFNENSNDR